MADQSISVEGPVDVVADSKARVALDLAKQIDAYSQTRGDQKDRSYWLTLYCQCYKAVNGYNLASIMNEEVAV